MLISHKFVNLIFFSPFLFSNPHELIFRISTHKTRSSKLRETAIAGDFDAVPPPALNKLIKNNQSILIKLPLILASQFQSSFLLSVNSLATFLYGKLC